MPPRTKAIILEQGRRLARREQRWMDKKNNLPYVFLKGTAYGFLNLTIRLLYSKIKLRKKDNEGSSTNNFVRVLLALFSLHFF